MEGSSDSSDKTRVLDIKALRILKPFFTNGNQAPPLVCTPPFGPLPPGYTPFYPFSLSQASQNTPDVNQVQNSPQSQPLNQPQEQPLNDPRQQALNQQKRQVLNPQQHQPQPLNFQQHQAQQCQVLSPQQDQFQPLNFQQHQALNQQQRQVLGPQQHQPQSLLFEQHQAMNQQQRQDLSTRQHQPQVSLEPLLVTPLSSSGTPEASNGDMEPGGSSMKRKRKKRSPPKFVNYDSGITVSERENGNKELVKDVCIRFDALRRRFFQLEDAKEDVSGIIKRPDMTVGAICMDNGVRTNIKKRLGTVPGVEIGDIFYFRFELCLVGLHCQSMAGIDCLVVKGETEDEPIATSIVSSGLYDKEKADPEILIYTGQGGKGGKVKEASDQKLVRGNLGLEKSLHKNSLVRVIRGLRKSSHDFKIYMYDGLYEISESWIETGKSGQGIFKYKLLRVPGQPPAFATWMAMQEWKKGDPRAGLVNHDISAGVESIAVSLVNDVDNEKEPSYFTYSTTVKYSESFKLAQPSVGCDCGNSCKPGNLNCHCIKKNGGDFPYISNGVLVSRKPMIHECSPACPCATCKNKVTQMGVKVKLEVFRTANRGWGLRSWDPIRAGSFICIYAGEAKDKSKVQQSMVDDDYTFDTTRVFTPFKWNYAAVLAEEDASKEISEEFQIPLPLIISAKNTGNVGRFMNHSCSPNVFWQPVSYESNGLLCLQVAFFAISHIPPMTELTYDYGLSLPNGFQSGNPLYGKKKCFCGSISCRGSFG